MFREVISSVIPATPSTPPPFVLTVSGSSGMAGRGIIVAPPPKARPRPVQSGPQELSRQYTTLIMQLQHKKIQAIRGGSINIVGAVHTYCHLEPGSDFCSIVALCVISKSLVSTGLAAWTSNPCLKPPPDSILTCAVAATAAQYRYHPLPGRKEARAQQISKARRSFWASAASISAAAVGASAIANSAAANKRQWRGFWP